MSLDLELLREASRDRVGDVLLRLDAKVVGSAARGRASCPVHRGDGLSLSFANGFATCHSGCGEKTFDALGLVAGAYGRDLSRADELRETALDLAEILGVRLDDAAPARPRVQRPAEARPAPAPAAPPRADLEGLVGRLAERDEEGEEYLRARGLLRHPLPEWVRFNRGSSDPWLAARELDGFVVAFLAHRFDGSLATISLRNVRPDGPPSPWPKTVTTKGASTSGAAICRREVSLLATGDSEFARDEIVVVEGGTDALAATIAWDLGALEAEVAPAWVLGAIGAGSAPAMLRAFAPAVRGRTVHVALDVDETGEEAATKAIVAAWGAGAARVTRLRPPAGKDLAEAWRANA